MDVARSGAAVIAVARFYLRPVRRAVLGGRRPAPGTWRVKLGPVDVGGHRVLLRSPRLSDGRDWGGIRLAERERIEPWWVSSSLSWEQRHTEAAWVRGWLHVRSSARAGEALPLVVEVDGRLAGQCGLDWINLFTRTGELGIWLDSRVAGHGIGAVAIAAVIEHAFAELGLQRVTAPVCVDNVAAGRTMQRAGMVREATLVSFLDVGGRRRDHDLWAIVAPTPAPTP